MPEPRPFLTASWRYLALLNYEVPPALLRPLVPVGTELDMWGGATLASIGGFRSEHYWGDTVQRDGGSKEYRVEHPPWRVWDTVGAQLDCDVKTVYGAGFAECLSVRPRSAFLAEGSAVTVSSGRRLHVAAKETLPGAAA